MVLMSDGLNYVSGNIVDPVNKLIYPGKIIISEGKISKIEREEASYSNYIIPGFVDSHIHIESSMLIPYEFSRIAVTHGTVATVSDPHEIANVLGIEGINYMIENSKHAPLKFYFGASSCVPATSFETSGACLGAKEIEEIFRNDNVNFLGEVMNVFGVINNDPEMIDKINIAKKYSKKIDGHAPGLTGKALDNYISKGIDTDHECVRRVEGLEKIEKGEKPLNSATGHLWHISISDTGPGIAKEHLESIFDPFFTTKREGNGLGLAIVNTIITRHEGLIEVQSEKGIGTIFHLYLPAIE